MDTAFENSLQSSGAKESAGLPKWLSTACGTLMTHRLVASSSGVVNLVKAVLEIGTPQAQTADLKKVEVVASILSNPTTSGSSDKCIYCYSGVRN